MSQATLVFVHVAVLLTLVGSIALIVWHTLGVRFRDHREEERQDRAALLSANESGVRAVALELRERMDRVTVVFDGMAASYDTLRRETRETRAELAGLKQTEAEHHADLDKRVKRLEEHPLIQAYHHVK